MRDFEVWFCDNVVSDSKKMSRAAPVKKRLSETIDPDIVVVPWSMPKRLPYRPGISAAKLKRIVAEVVNRRHARELEAASRSKPAE